MNELLEILNEFGFVRLGSKLGNPIIINCVPGAGKTTLISKLLERSESFVAYTTTIASERNLTGKRIELLPTEIETNKLVLLDEYQNLEKIPSFVFAAFGDPLQSRNPSLLKADFICHESKRIGIKSAKLLRSLGFNITSFKEDKVAIGDIFSVEPVGQIICFEREVVELLEAHSADFLTTCEVQGKTFEVVTFINSGVIHSSELHNHLICLTRHSKELNILCPNSEYKLAGQAKPIDIDASDSSS